MIIEQIVNDKFILCECRGEGMLISHLSEGNYQEFDISIFRDYNYSNSFWSRLKYAAWHMWTGKKHSDQLTMSYEKAQELISFMTDMMKKSSFKPEIHSS